MLLTSINVSKIQYLIFVTCIRIIIIIIVIYIYMNNDLFDKSIIDLIFVYIQVDAPLPQ